MKPSILKSAMLSMCLFLGTSICGAATITVGPSGQYATPCAAFPHLSDGDTVQIDANGGTPYLDTTDCYIRNNNVTITGINGRPILDAVNAGIAKGIWVEDGHDVVIDNFEFRNAKYNGSSGNAAGIRIEDGDPGGGNVTVQRCYIHDNGDGVLGGNVDATDMWYSANPFITFQYDEFYNNGDGSGSTHNMYMGFGGNMNFTLQYTWSHDSYVGHTVKTRAPINNILYNLVGDNLGNTSYVLDFPLGGSTYIVGNVIYKSQTTNGNSNTAMFIWRDVYDNTASDPEYGTPNEDLHFINNTMIDDPNNGFPTAFVSVSCFNASSDTCAAPGYGPVLTVPAVVENNIFLGAMTEVTNQPSAHVTNNIIEANTAANLAALFVDPAHFDYHLKAGSPAIQAGVYPPTDNAGVADPKALAKYEYVHVANKVTRPTPTGSTMDDGAYSYPRVDTPPAISASATSPVTVPNTGTITVTGLPTPAAGQYNYVSFVSENTAAIPSPTTVATSTGTATATFQTLAVVSNTVVTIDVYANGAHTSTNVTVVAGAPVLSGLTIDGPYYPASTVHLLGGSTNPVVINLSSSNPTVLYVPSTVTIPAGQLTAETGSINGSLWGQTPSSQSATLTATYAGVTKTLVINVAAPFIHNFYGPTSVVGGQVASFALVMAGDYPPAGGPMYITSDTPAVIPNQTITLPGGNFNGNINVNTNAVTTNTTVNVTANVNGSLWGASILVTPGGPVPASIAVVSGSGQTAQVGSNFTNPLVVVVKDSSGAAVSGATVTFASSGVSFPGGATAVTNSSGQASVTAQPSTTGALSVTASVSGVGTPATFSETGTANTTPASVAVVSGSGQSSPVGTNFTNPLVVVVKNSAGGTLSGVTVTYASSGATFPNGATAVTNSSGQASLAARPSTTGAITVTASVAGVGAPASFSETGTSAGVAVSSITLDTANLPQTTVHLTAAAPAGGAVVTIHTTNSSILYAPTTVTVPAGQTSAEIGTETGSLWGQSPATKSATVSAVYGGVTKTLAVTVYAPYVNHFYCNIYPCTIVGGQSINNFIVGIVGDYPRTGGPVTFTSSNTAVIPNQTFTAPGGNFYTGFILTTNAVTTSTQVTISISVNGSTKSPTQVVTVNPAGVALSSITQDSPYQSGTTVHLAAAAPAGGEVVTLSTSDSSIEYVPASVTVPAGQTSAETGSLLGSLWGQSPFNKSATVTGVGGGVTKTLTMSVPTTAVHGFYPNSSVQGGQLLGFYMETSFNPAPVNGAPYTVSSDQPSIIPTQSFTLAAGQSNDFGRNLTTNAVATTTTVNLTLNYNGVQWGAPVTVTH